MSVRISVSGLIAPLFRKAVQVPRRPRLNITEVYKYATVPTV